ncbi:MAG TPA: lyase family protein, partial [Jiangellaceae bacterium]|nr:lyase family protein [Jiangellaceae bacterium]
LRLMAARGKMQESYANGRVGSSSMPHKVNPTQCERLAGMARLAAGYASMLQTAQTWDQRDIAHSSVERVAIPDLMHVLFHSFRTLANILRGAIIEPYDQATTGAWRAPYSAWAALHATPHVGTRLQARETARRWVSGLVAPDDPPIPDLPSPAWFTRQHPDLTAGQAP